MSEIVDTNPRRFGCNGCDVRWGGYRQAHCPSCHRTFAGLGGFDRHRQGGTCQDPATEGGGGMVLDAYGVWTQGEGGSRTAPRRPPLSTTDEIDRRPGRSGHPQAGDVA